MFFLKGLTPLIALGALQVPAVPPPPEQVAADCAAPSYASDVLVCTDPVLRAFDLRMLEAWAALDVASAVAPQASIESQAAWFRRRSMCAFSERHVECLMAAYIERIAVLEALGRAGLRTSRRGSEASCPGAPWGSTRAFVRAPETGALVIEDDHARVLAAATPARPDGVWTPFVGFEVDGPVIRLQPLEGPTITCTLTAPR